MSDLTPPPRIVDKFSTIWKEWLGRVHDFISTHTGGSNPVSPATGTSWNAHGNTATGDSSTHLKIDEGTFYALGTSGTTPSDIESASTHLAWIPSKAAFRAQANSGTQDADGSIGLNSFAFGKDNIASDNNGFLIGVSNTGSANNHFIIGRNNTASSNTNYIIGESNTASGRDQYIFGSDNDVTPTSVPDDMNFVFGQGNNLVAGTDSTIIGVGNTLNAPILSAICIGTNSSTLAFKGLCIGTESTASGNYATALGNSLECSGQGSVAVGFDQGIGNVGPADQCIGVGSYIDATGDRSITIGTGVDTTNRLSNPTDNTMWMGVNSTIPTFIMRNNTGGAATKANIGIIEQDPKSTLDVGGSVGYKSRYINSGTGTTLTDELVVVVDIAAPYTITLPQISTVPRRMYHIRRAKGAGKVTIQPNAADSFDEGGAGVSDSGLTLAAGASIQIVADTDPTTDTWWII